ncbi:hypothetical protein ACFP3I_18460 [Chryseobacterium arachidis]
MILIFGLVRVYFYGVVSGFLDVYRCIICTTMIKSFLTSLKVILM